MKTRSPAAFLRRNGAAIVCAVGLYILFFQMVMNFRLNPASADDFRSHMLWAIQMTGRDVLSSFYDGSLKLWHIFVKYTYTFLTPNLWKAAAGVTAAADAVAYLLLVKIWDRALPEKFPRWLLAPIVLSVFLLGALTLPGGAFYMKDGVVQGAVNTWHNPTNIMVRPFALAVFYMTVNIYNRRRTGRAGILPGPEGGDFAFEGGFWRQFCVPVFTRWELVLYPLCLLLSAWAKPSFLQFFGPAILLFLLIDVVRTRGMLLPFCLKLALAYVPAGYILYRQFFRNFSAIIPASVQVEAVESSIGAGPHGVQIYLGQDGPAGLGEVLSRLVTDWAPLVLFCALPLFLIAIAPKKGLSLPATRLGLICVLVGRLEAVLFHETGTRATHGNFVWGFSLAAWMFWTAAIGQYALLLPERSARGKLARYGGTALLLWHLAAGAAYAWLIFRTVDYRF